MDNVKGLTFKRRTYFLLSFIGCIITLLVLSSIIGITFLEKKYKDLSDDQFKKITSLEEIKLDVIEMNSTISSHFLTIDDNLKSKYSTLLEKITKKVTNLKDIYPESEKEVSAILNHLGSYKVKAETYMNNNQKESDNNEITSKTTQINLLFKNVEDQIYSKLLKKEFAVQLFKLQRDFLNFIQSKKNEDLDKILTQKKLLSSLFIELGTPVESQNYMNEQLNNIEKNIKSISFTKLNINRVDDSILMDEFNSIIKDFGLILNDGQIDYTKKLSNLDFYKNLILSFVGIVGLISLAGLAYNFSYYIKIADFIYEMIEKIDENVSGDTEGVEKLNSAAEIVSSSVSEQAKAVDGTVTTLEQLTQIVSVNLDNAKNSLEMTKNSHGNVMETKKSIQNVVHSIKEIDGNNKDIVEQVTKSNKDMEEIVSVIQNISDKTSVINDIVFQTKLLSFNASVEAARAGEHGKGFAVVAEEVGNLAQMSGNAAREIEEMLDGSVEKVRDIVKLTSSSISGLVEKGTVKTNQGIKAASDCEGLLEEVVKHSLSIKESMNSIVAAGQEQDKGIRQIKSAMTQLDNSINDISFTAKNTAHFAHRIESSSKLNRNYLHKLRNILRGNKEKDTFDKKVISLPLKNQNTKSTQLINKKAVGESIPSANDNRFNE